jgi:oligopeptide transport system permease protein
MIYTIPGDPISALVDKLPETTRRQYLVQYGFDQPLPVQYLRFVRQLLHGDLGSSLRYPGRKVVTIIAGFAPVTAALGGTALIVGFSLGIILGIIAALYRNKWPDKVIMILAILGTAIPAFVTASLLQYFFTVHWRLFPTVGWGELRYAILPGICLAAGPIAGYARFMRSSVLDTVNKDYILTAEAKGASAFRIVFFHVFRNSFLPCLTMLCTGVGSIFSGAFIVENIFAIPGLGKYFISSINDRDYSMVLGLTLVFTGIYVVSILVSDILLCLIDPRIRLTGGKQ